MRRTFGMTFSLTFLEHLAMQYLSWLKRVSAVMRRVVRLPGNWLVSCKVSTMVSSPVTAMLSKWLLHVHICSTLTIHF